jgi:tRNA(Ile)-lysidine synthase
MKVKRILLDYSKEELKNYCEDNCIEYGVDETNFDESYLRNNIRHNVIKNMSLNDKKKVIDEINGLNKSKEREYCLIHDLLEKCKIGNNIIDLKLFNVNNDISKVSILYYFVIENVKKRISISEKRIVDIIGKINSSKPNIELGKFEEFVLYKEYDRLVIKEDESEFSYIIDGLESDIGKFVISDNGKKLEKVIVSREQLPLTIESYKGDDSVINRLFIDKKIPVSKRKCWPVVKDKLGRVLLVLNIEKFYNNLYSNDDKIEFYIVKKEEERV